MKLKWIGVALIYLGFFGLIGFACWFLESGWPLLALILTPNYSER